LATSPEEIGIVGTAFFVAISPADILSHSGFYQNKHRTIVHLPDFSQIFLEKRIVLEL
jgi:hypothetical protein